MFSRDATDYKFIQHHGFSSIPGDHIYADKAPMRHGQRRKYTALAQRPVSFDIIIQSTDLDEQQALIQALSASFNPLDGAGILQYTKEDGTIYYLNCIGVNGNPFIADDKSQTYQKATIKLTADEDPFWHSGVPLIEYFDPGPGNFFPFPNGTGTWPWSLSSKNKIKTCTNNGSVDAPIIVTFTGPMTNPCLTRTKIVNGGTVVETLSFTLVLGAGETLIVNTDPDVMTAVYSVGSKNAHKYADTTSTFWQLGRGINTVELDPTTSSSGALASVQFSPRYVGV